MRSEVSFPFGFYLSMTYDYQNLLLLPLVLLLFPLVSSETMNVTVWSWGVAYTPSPTHQLPYGMKFLREFYFAVFCDLERLIFPAGS